jgi:hypothetical protein
MDDGKFWRLTSRVYRNTLVQATGELAGGPDVVGSSSPSYRSFSMTSTPSLAVARQAAGEHVGARTARAVRYHRFLWCGWGNESGRLWFLLLYCFYKPLISNG